MGADDTAGAVYRNFAGAVSILCDKPFAILER
jgi:hypothetical protein